jgi:hypothetical protein
MRRRRMASMRRVIPAGVGLVLLSFCGMGAMAEASERTSPLISPRQLRTNVDVSPLPSDTGDFVSLGLDGRWRRPERLQAQAGTDIAAIAEPPANCSREAIIHYAWQAPTVFEMDKKGLLYGVETHTPATRMGNIPGFNSCALVVYAILKRAGCTWLKYTADAKGVFDMAVARGWRRTDRQEGGCIVAWNSREEGKKPAIGRDGRGERVLFRHVGITTGNWLAMDNTSLLSRPQPFITWRAYKYTSPMYLCPPAESAATAP